MTALRSSRKDYRQVNEIKIQFGIPTRKKPLLLQANWPRCKRRKTGGRTDRAISPHVDRSFQSCKQNLATLESWQARLSSQTNQLKTGGGRNFGVASASRCYSCLRAD